MLAMQIREDGRTPMRRQKRGGKGGVKRRKNDPFYDVWGKCVCYVDTDTHTRTTISLYLSDEE